MLDIVSYSTDTSLNNMYRIRQVKQNMGPHEHAVKSSYIKRVAKTITVPSLSLGKVEARHTLASGPC